jgi:hypothetical protein
MTRLPSIALILVAAIIHAPTPQRFGAWARPYAVVVPTYWEHLAPDNEIDGLTDVSASTNVGQQAIFSVEMLGTGPTAVSVLTFAGSDASGISLEETTAAPSDRFTSCFGAAMAQFVTAAARLTHHACPRLPTTTITCQRSPTRRWVRTAGSWHPT